jgi:hypothetical protein
MPTIRLTLRLQPESDAMYRVLCLCRRRRIEVRALEYSGDAMSLTLAGDATRVERTRHWIASLIGVVGIGSAPSAARLGEEAA